MAYYRRMDEMIGKTPLLLLERFSKHYNITAQLFAKLEYLNPTGSAKDRAALYMIREAEKNGLLKPGSTIIEPTSGNTGIGLAAVGAVSGYRVILVMPDTMSTERRKLLHAYGAELVLTPGSEGMAGAVRRAAELCKEIPDAFQPDQFSNAANAIAHEETTGPEIFEALNGAPDMLVATIGTGGTITGTGRYLKKHAPKMRIIGVEPADSPLLSQGKAGPHKLQGIGANFIPSVLDRTIYDSIETVSTEDAYNAVRRLASSEGVLCGISSGAALSAAIRLGQRASGGRIVVILPDSGDRYLSDEVF